MNQVQQKATKKVEDTLKADEFKRKLSGIKEVAKTRKVKLVYKSCCGCGCDYVDIIRVVPMDSPLKDGDVAKKMLKTDKWA